MHPLLALCQSFIQLYKLYMCSVPVATEHWLCDALFVSPTITYLVSMARSRCVNSNLINLEFCINCQWRDDTHSEQFCHTVKAALYSITIQCSHYTEDWVVNKPLKLQP